VNELGYFYLVPITLGGSGVFQQVGGMLNTFGFVPVSPGITDGQDAVNEAVYWRFNYSFGGLTTDSFSTDNAFPTYGLKPNNVLGMDGLLFQFDSSVPEPATGFLVVPILGLLLFLSPKGRRDRSKGQRRPSVQILAVLEAPTASGLRQRIFTKEHQRDDSLSGLPVNNA
jgi:hypothetical protein